MTCTYLRRFAAAAALLSGVLLIFPVAAAPIENPPVPSVCGIGGNELAVTCMFTGNLGGGAGRPVSARTDFIEDWDTLGYSGLTLATHELFHAIGFTINYTNFANFIIATPGAGNNPPPAGSRSYSTNGAANGITLALTPANQATHADPNATGAAPWPATGYNQANDIMQPELPKNTVRTISQTDADVLNNSFGWATSGIHINLINLNNTHDDTDIAIINAAIAAVNAFFPDKGGAPVFTWTVAEVIPEPSSITLLLGAGILALIVTTRRHKHVMTRAA